MKLRLCSYKGGAKRTFFGIDEWVMTDEPNRRISFLGCQPAHEPHIQQKRERERRRQDRRRRAATASPRLRYK
jgi:hypothetical protein